ncbi:hypothetical protein HYW18_02270 [Candidatus Uhrbacteria bacterium]|nr:hypothetical protein [Candidatus Uhrbacteria bacterium]
MRYLLFGMSTAFGQTDYEHGGWAGRLRQWLDTKEKRCHFHNLAISGDTTRDVLGRMESETRVRLRGKPKKEWTMFISLGGNDARVEDDVSKVPEDEYRENVLRILTLAKELTGHVLWVGDSPVVEDVCNPWKGYIFFLNERIKMYERIAKEVCQAEHVPFIEIFSVLEARSDLRDLTDDGLHPNAKGHLLIFEEIKKSLESAGI